MKQLFRPLLASACLLVLAGPLARAVNGPPPEPPRVRLSFTNWQKFTDIVVDGLTSKIGSDAIYNELNRHLTGLARKQLAPGQTLVITMRDIDLAGVVEPWRGADFGHVRYLRDTHPPRLVFDYELLAPDGSVLQQGSAKLTNLAFRYQAFVGDRGDITYFEKQLLTDWMRNAFTPAKKAKKHRRESPRHETMEINAEPPPPAPGPVGDLPPGDPRR